MGARLARGAAAIAASLLLAALPLGAQDAGSAGSGQGSSSEDDLFGAETVTQSSTDAATAAPQKDFLKYDVTRVGGRLDGSLGWSATWADPWSGGLVLLDPVARSLSPSLKGSVKITAKPSTDYGVNMEFRTSNPFSLSADSGTTTVTVPNISVWTLAAKFSWNDALFFSFGKQPLAWGVSKSFFQPADDIFALSAVDNANTGADREGPIAFKAQYGIPLTMTNFYFFAGVPDQSGLDLGDLRLATKAETSFGNTELAAGAYYAYADHPRALLMGTTGTGNFNFFGEAVAKWGSERYFLSEGTPAAPGLPAPISGAQKSDRLWFSGTLGGYYMDSDNNITVSASYFYNGEGQSGVSALEAFKYYSMNPSEADRMHFGSHYASASFAKSKLLVDELSFSLYALGDLSDQSLMVVPSLTWQFFDYFSLALGSTLSFGPDGSEYPTLSSLALGDPNLMGKPTASISLTATLGSGAF